MWLEERLDVLGLHGFGHRRCRALEHSAVGEQDRLLLRPLRGIQVPLAHLALTISMTSDATTFPISLSGRASTTTMRFGRL